MEYLYSTEEATQKLYSRLSDATGWKYLKGRRCLKNSLEDLVFEINFYTSKWNLSHQSIEMNAEFRLQCKTYGKLPVDNIISSISYRPQDNYWYDISTEEKLNSVFQELHDKIQNTAVSLYSQFKTDYSAAVKSLLKEHFDEYHVHLDFIADKLGMPIIQDKAQEIYENLSDEMKQQVTDYKNGIRNKPWMINRCNLKYIVDNDLIKQ